MVKPVHERVGGRVPFRVGLRVAMVDLTPGAVARPLSLARFDCEAVLGGAFTREAMPNREIVDVELQEPDARGELLEDPAPEV